MTSEIKAKDISNGQFSSCQYSTIDTKNDIKTSFLPKKAFHRLNKNKAYCQPLNENSSNIGFWAKYKLYKPKFRALKNELFLYHTRLLSALTIIALKYAYALKNHTINQTMKEAK